MEMQEQLKKVISEMQALSEIWDENQIKQYPAYLPDFDEFIIDLARMLSEEGE